MPGLFFLPSNTAGPVPCIFLSIYFNGLNFFRLGQARRKGIVLPLIRCFSPIDVWEGNNYEVTQKEKCIYRSMAWTLV